MGPFQRHPGGGRKRVETGKKEKERKKERERERESERETGLLLLERQHSIK